MRVFNRKNLKSRAFIFSAIGIIAILFILIITAYKVVEVPGLCVTCHIEQGPYDAWKKSTHSRVKCLDCHVKPGLLNGIKYRAGLVSKIITQVVQSPTRPTTIILPDNANCENCHKTNRKITASGDIIIPHKAHVKVLRMRCVTCHRQLVHARGTGARNKPGMTICYKCHDGKVAKNSCSACHTDKNTPEDHRVADWLVIHSQAQKQDPANCEKCHGWVQDYCKECHQRKPRSHAGKWRTHHRDRIAALGMKNCLQCHNEQFCVRCHGIMPAAAPSG